MLKNMPSLFTERSIAHCQIGDCVFKHSVTDFLAHYIRCHNEGLARTWNGKTLSVDFYVALWQCDEIRSIAALAYMGTPGQPPRQICLRNELLLPGYQFARKSVAMLVLGELNCTNVNTGRLPLLRDEYTLCVYVAASPTTKPIEFTLNAQRRGGSVVRLDPVVVGYESQFRNQVTLIGNDFDTLCYRQFQIPHIELSELVMLQITLVEPFENN